MVRPSEDDKEAIDRAFAKMVADYHLTADRPEPPAAAPEDPADPAPEPDTGRLDAPPVFRFVESPAAPRGRGATRRRQLRARTPAAAATPRHPRPGGLDRDGLRGGRCAGRHVRHHLPQLGRMARGGRIPRRLRNSDQPATTAPAARCRRRCRPVADTGSGTTPATAEHQGPPAGTQRRRGGRIRVKRCFRFRRRGQNAKRAESGGSRIECRARSAAPISPASLPN